MKAMIVRMPDALHAALMAEASREQVSTNTVIVRVLAEYAGGTGREKGNSITIYEEMANIPGLQAVGIALVQYAESLDGSRFSRTPNGWVMAPVNFVALRVQWKQSQDLMMTLRGRPGEFESELGLGRELELKPARGGYSRCWVTHPKHLKAAIAYIALAHQLYRRGRRR